MEKQQKSVRIRLFQDNGRYKGDLFVSVNGVNYKIRRGERRTVTTQWPRREVRRGFLRKEAHG